VLMVRETPYNLIHIRNMEQVTLAGGIILPCTPSFYNNPKNIEEILSTVTDRVITMLGLAQHPNPWKEN
jgi:4-hydroxy-3-polyprenylbenzoate decarboxylase